MKYIVVTFNKDMTTDQIEAFKRSYELDDYHKILSGNLFRIINNNVDVNEILENIFMDKNVLKVRLDDSDIKKNCI